MVQIVTKNNLGSTFKFDEQKRKINVNIDNDTISQNADGALAIKAAGTGFIEAVRSAQTLTSFGSRVDTITSERFLTYTNEHGLTEEINLSALLTEVKVGNASLKGQVLTLDTGDTTIVIDLSLFMTEEETTAAISKAFNEVAVDAFGTQLFKVASV